MKNRIKISLGALTVLASCSAGQDIERPNIIVILADDMGYSDVGCYGGEIETPNIDYLAQNGLRWQQFYNNARSCPSRAVLMTGLYPHQAGMGWMAAADMQRPQYQGYLNRQCVTIAEVLKESGYGTYMAGKWHLSSDRQNNGGIIEGWPCQRGFDRFYGIPGGASNYFKTTMVDNNTRKGTEEDFYFTRAVSDSAANFISRHDYAEKPLFLYLAYTAPHWPLHALQKDIDKYKERYMAGWDKLREERFRKQKELGLFKGNTVLSPRDSNVMAWDNLTDKQKEEYAMRMAIYAAQIDAMDQGIGKVIKALKAAGQFDNTLIMFMSDNGACAEFISSGKRKIPDGKEDTYESYRINWANLSSTPYREYKHFTNEGGIASPLIVSWPAGIDKSLNGKFIREYGYFADIMATCVDVAGAKYPTVYHGNAITPLEGISLRPNFSGDTTSRGMTFWEHEANIAARDGKWKIVLKTGEGNKYDFNKIELYDMDADPTELHDLADIYPERVSSMFSKWQEWAEKVKAFPLDTRFYNERQNDYKRVINGEFNENFGAWVKKCDKNADIRFSIETDTPISGPKSARIDINKNGNRENAAFLKWVFPANAGEILTTGFRYNSTGENSMEFRIEDADSPGTKLLSEKVVLNGVHGEFNSGDIRIPEKGKWQLVFYFGKSSPGSIIIDNVKLDFKQ